MEQQHLLQQLVPNLRLIANTVAIIPPITALGGYAPPTGMLPIVIRGKYPQQLTLFVRRPK